MWQSLFAALIATSSGSASQLDEKHQEPTITVASLRDALIGEWVGALGYKDYRSGRLTELPVQTTIRATGDGLTQIRVSRFEEGRARQPVFTTTVSGFLANPAQLDSAFFRGGRAAELQTETVVLQRYKGPDDWTIIYSQVGQDDDQPAEIRITETLNRDELVAVKEVRPISPRNSAWAFRNQVRLRRATDKK